MLNEWKDLKVAKKYQSILGGTITKVKSSEAVWDDKQEDYVYVPCTKYKLTPAK